MIDIQERESENTQNIYQFDPCLMKMICRDIEALFQDRYIYLHKDIQKQIKKNQKGYLKIETVLKRINIEDYLNEYDQFYRKVIIFNSLKLYSRHLYCNGLHIRRIVPFKNCLKLTRPLYLQNFPIQNNHTELQELIENVTKIYAIEYNDEDGWALVYVEDACKLMQLNGWQWRAIDGQKTKYQSLMIQTHEECSHQFDLTNGARIYVQYMESYSRDMQQIFEDKQNDDEMKDENCKSMKKRMYGKQEIERIESIQEKDKKGNQNHRHRNQKDDDDQNEDDSEDEDSYKPKNKMKSSLFLLPNLSFNQRLLSIVSKQ